jgi:transposase
MKLSDYIDYLSCTRIKENYFNEDVFFEWIIDDLLLHCNVYSTSHSVIIMKNCSIHVNSRIRETIETHDCRVKYLFSYSSDYNSVELSFSVLKTWVRRHYHQIWSSYESTFKEFLKYAVEMSRCDQFAKTDFRCNVEDYIFEENIRGLNESLHTDTFQFF